VADYDSSLPIRSEADGTDERVHVKIVDGVASPSVNKVQVDGDNNLHVEIHGNDPGGSDRVVRTSEQGAVVVDGVYAALTNSDPANIGLVAAVRAASPADADQTQRLTAKTGTTDTTVHALDVSLHDQNGNQYTQANPLPVSISNATAGSTEVLTFSSATVVAGATHTYTYTVSAGKSFIVQKISAAASGKMKMAVSIGTIGAESLKIVKFNSTASPNVDYKFESPQSIADTQDLVVVLSNYDNQSQDLYVTVEGYEI
jgi:hypothetical protein